MADVVTERLEWRCLTGGTNEICDVNSVIEIMRGSKMPVEKILDKL